MIAQELDRLFVLVCISSEVRRESRVLQNRFKKPGIVVCTKSIQHCLTKNFRLRLFMRREPKIELISNPNTTPSLPSRPDDYAVRMHCNFATQSSLFESTLKAV